MSMSKRLLEGQSPWSIGKDLACFGQYDARLTSCQMCGIWEECDQYGLSERDLH